MESKGNIMCPNCSQIASEAYKLGYEKAMEVYQNEMLKASKSRPISYIVDKDQVLIDENLKE